MKERVTLLFSKLFVGKWRKITTPLVIGAVVSVFLFFPRGQANDGSLTHDDLYDSLETTVESENLAVVEALEDETTAKIIVVDVKGAVAYPNVYTLEDGQRLIDAITLAGGYTPDADSRLLNHAQRLTDEAVIYVPKVGEEPPEFELPNDGTSDDEGAVSQLVNINTADETQLQTLTGVGPAKSSAIVKYRTNEGAFQVIEDLMNVSGIGEKTFEALSDFISVD